MLATTSFSALPESRVSCLTRLSVDKPEPIFSNDVVAPDIFESFLPARISLRPDRVPDVIDVLSTLSRVHLGEDGEVNREHVQNKSNTPVSCKGMSFPASS
jgi:hypothetical protein